MRIMRSTGASSIKHYSYDEGDRSARDIGMNVLGNGSGKIEALENGMGLPIVSWLAYPMNSRRPLLACDNRYYVDYKCSVYAHPRFSPCEYSNFDDGMQPVVTTFSERAGRRVFWCMDMKAIERSYIQDTNVLRTVTAGEGFRLTCTDFMSWETDAFVRIYHLENCSGSRARFALAHYLPLNPYGREVKHTSPEYREHWREMKPYNAVRWSESTATMVFSILSPEEDMHSTCGVDPAPHWIVGANRVPSEIDCAQKPEVMNRLDRGESGYASAEGLVDAQMTFDTGLLKNGESFDVTIVHKAYRNIQDTEKLAVRFRSDLFPLGSDGSKWTEKAVANWNRWLSTADQVLNGVNREIRSFCRRMLCYLKNCLREDGLPAADSYMYPECFIRDARKPAMAFGFFGYQEEAKGILLGIAALLSYRGFDNCCGITDHLKERIIDGFKNAPFPLPEDVPPDYPEEYVLTVAKYLETYPQDHETLEKIYPAIYYALEMRHKFSNPDGLVYTVGDSTNDDFLMWSFWRGSERQYKKGREGVICAYFNMEWAVALEKGAICADKLGHTEDAENWRTAAARIRKQIETRFWNEELGQYAYFYDPNPIDQYGTRDMNNPQTAYIGIKDEKRGMYVFPDPPLLHGMTIPYLAEYSSDVRAHRAYKSTRNATGPLRNIFDLLKERADRASIYYQYIQAQVLADDPDIDRSISWILKETPFCGAPERFPTNRSTPLAWCTADALLAMYLYIAKQKK